MQVADNYPGDAAKGADYISSAARGNITNGPKPRPERVIITDLYIEHEGRLCVGERTVRHMANLLGLYEGERVDIIVAQNAQLRSEVEVQAAEVDSLRARLTRAEASTGTKVYVSADNDVEFSTAAAARAYGSPVPAPDVVDDPEAEVTPAPKAKAATKKAKT